MTATLISATDRRQPMTAEQIGALVYLQDLGRLSLSEVVNSVEGQVALDGLKAAGMRIWGGSLQPSRLAQGEKRTLSVQGAGVSRPGEVRYSSASVDASGFYLPGRPQA